MDLEHSFDFDTGIERQFRDADGGAGMAARIAQSLDHQVGGAVHDGGEGREGRHRIDEAAEADAAHDLVEIADGGLELGEQVDGAQARRFLADFGRDFRTELALVGIGELAVEAEAELPGNDDQVSGPNEWDIIRNRCGRRRRE